MIIRNSTRILLYNMQSVCNGKVCVDTAVKFDSSSQYWNVCLCPVSNLHLTISPCIADYLSDLRVFVFPASMASSEVKAKPGSDVTPVGENTLHFNDDTLKGEDSCYYLIRSRWNGKLFNGNLHC